MSPIPHRSQPRSKNMRANPPPRFRTGAPHSTSGNAIRQSNLGFVNFLRAVNLGANNRAFPADIRNLVPLNQGTRLLQRRPAADISKEIGIYSSSMKVMVLGKDSHKT